jgi:tRNA (uracil-5-)-methyltransferase
MISKIRPASPLQASLQPLDKKSRVTPPDAITRKRSKKKKRPTPEFESPEDVISREVVGLLGNQVVSREEADGVDWESPFGFREEVELTVSSISSTGM